MAAQRCKCLCCCSEPFHANHSQVDNLPASGLDMVLTQALYAIVGALALEQGGAVANRVARERVLLPAGLKTQSIAGSTDAEREQVSA